MQAEAIFAPMLTLMLLTFMVLGYTGYKRFSAGFAGRVKSHDFRYGETANVPGDVAVTNRNFMNLLEMPVLFYLLCLSAYITRHVTEFTVLISWAYVALRLAHCVIHLTYNRILHRFTVYAASNIVLLALWASLAADLMG
jgi:hypothetical protein